MHLVSGHLSAAYASDCRQRAIEKLRTSAPDGFAVYQQIEDQAFFKSWITCDDAQFDLSTAVHESVHFITESRDAFPLVDGGEIKRSHEVSRFFAPSIIAKDFHASDFVATYLRPGRSSAATDFLYLLDELNAYTHDLHAAVDLKDLRSPEEDVDHRDGLAALMAFVAVYVQTAEDSAPATWTGLRKPEVARTVSVLWEGAESVMASSCGIPGFGSEDRTFLRQLCQTEAQSSLQAILGRAPVCPIACLQAKPDAEPMVEASIETPSNRKPAHHSPANMQAARIFLGRGRHTDVQWSDDLDRDQITTSP